MVHDLVGTARTGGDGRRESPSRTDNHTQFTRFDHPRVMRVLARITADFDALARRDPQEETAVPADDA